MKRFLFVLIFLTLYSTSVALPPRPMESVTKYNVVLIHGAADSSSGFIGKCQNNVRGLNGKNAMRQRKTRRGN